MQVSCWAVFVLSLTLSLQPVCAEDAARIIDEIQQHSTGERQAAAVRTYAQVEKASAALVTNALSTVYRQTRHAEVREAVVETVGALTFLHDLPFSDILQDALQCDDRQLQMLSLDAITLLGENSLPLELRPLLLQSAQDESAEIRSRALTALKEFRNPPDGLVRAVVAQAVHDRDAMVRMNAVAAIWRWDGDLKFAVTCWLRELESTPDPDAAMREEQVRDFIPVAAAATIRNLGMEQPEAIVPVLVELVQHESPVVRAASARTLGAIAEQVEAAVDISRHHSAEEQLQQLLEDKYENVRENAAIGLQRLRRAQELRATGR